MSYAPKHRAAFGLSVGWKVRGIAEGKAKARKSAEKQILPSPAPTIVFTHSNTLVEVSRSYSRSTLEHAGAYDANKSKTKLKWLITKKVGSKHGVGKVLYDRRTLLLEKIVNLGLDKYFFFYFPVILYICVFSCVKYILRRKVVIQDPFLFFLISKVFCR